MDGTALVAAMSGRLTKFRAPLDAAGPSGLDAVTGRLQDLRHLGVLIAAVVTQDGAAKASE